MNPRIYVPILGLILAGIIPFFVNPYIQNIMNLIVLFSIGGVAWNIFGGYARQVSLGHAIFFGVGAYTSTLLLIKLGISPWIGMIAGGILSVAIGYFMGKSIMHLRGHYFAIATIVFSQVAMLLVTRFQDFTGGAQGLNVPIADSLWLLQFSDKLPYYYIFLGVLILLVFIVRKIEKSRLGYYMVAMGQDDQAASAIGIKIPRVKHIALAISAFFTSAAGTLYAQYMYFIDPKAVFDVPLSVKFAMVSIIGGLGTAMGPVVGAIIMEPTIEVTNHLAETLGIQNGLNYFLYGVILIVVVILIPNGFIRPITRLYEKCISILPGGKSNSTLAKGYERIESVVPGGKS